MGTARIDMGAQGRAAAGTGDSKDNRAYLRQRGITPRLARGGVVDHPWPASLEGRAVAVVAELLSAVAGALGARLGQVLGVRAAGVCARLLQAGASRSQPATRGRLARGPSSERRA